MADHDTPFASLFAVEDFGAEQEVPTAAGFGDQDEDGFGANGEAIDTEYMLGGDDYRIEDGGEDIGFGADPGLVDQPLYADELLLAEKSAEQLERLEEESFQRQAENQAHGGAGLFTAALPASDDDISLHVSQFAEPETLEAGSAEDALQGGQEGAQSSSAGYSKNTIRAIHILDAACTSENVPVADSVLTSKDGGPLLSYQSVVRDAHRSDAVKLFFELLVLKSKDFIDVKQSAPFEDIMIAPCAKLRSAADSISQKLTKEQQAANKKHRKQSHVSQLDRRSPRSLSSSAGFVKIEHDRRPVKEHTRAKGLESGEDGDETAEVTLTAKALAAKTKWQQSGAAKSQMQSKLRDPSLAGWQRRKIELKLKHGDDQWDPAKKIATSSMEKIRLLNAEFPEVWTMQRLSEQFKVSQETVRRILKSRFRPSAEHTEKREQKRKAEMQAYREKTKPHHERTDGRQPDVYDAVN
ncbi:Required for respiratory growth protein 9 mitochondrial [Coemansia sp. RSA 2322]|nr:Required for respiratory growth protein 9 mitochondrial [Coemansia sp. RSA 2322]